jgi:dihydroorotase-like cyclic amidohydrolase
MYDVLVRGGTVVTETATEPLDVAVTGERIVALGSPGSLGSDAAIVIDAERRLVLPGGVDPHVHYSLGFGPVRAESQDYSSAAAVGGTTTIIDFALQEAPASLHEAIAAKKAEAYGRMAVDWSLHAIVAGPEVSFDVVDEIGDVVRGGIPTVKTFMTYGWMTDDGQRLAIMQATADAGGMSVVQEMLWRALVDDRLQAVGTDHFAFSVRDRYERMGTTVDQLQAGIASVELRLPVLFHLGVNGGRLSLERFVELVATSPAKLMGLYPRKGTIAVGSDADLVVVDPDRTWIVRAEDLHMSSDYSCWEGWELRGRVETTLLRGETVVDSGRFVGRRDGGRFLERTRWRETEADARRSARRLRQDDPPRRLARRRGRGPLRVALARRRRQ